VKVVKVKKVKVVRKRRKESRVEKLYFWKGPACCGAFFCWFFWWGEGVVGVGIVFVGSNGVSFYSPCNVLANLSL